MKKNKVYLSYMTHKGINIPVVCNATRVNRKITVYYCEKEKENSISSIFFVIRNKDIEFLKKDGYSIHPIVLEDGYTPRAYRDLKFNLITDSYKRHY